MNGNDGNIISAQFTTDRYAKGNLSGDDFITILKSDDILGPINFSVRLWMRMNFLNTTEFKLSFQKMMDITKDFD